MSDNNTNLTNSDSSNPILDTVLIYYSTEQAIARQAAGDKSANQDIAVVERFLGQKGSRLSEASKTKLRRAWCFYLVKQPPPKATLGPTYADLRELVIESGYIAQDTDQPPEEVFRFFDRMFSANPYQVEALDVLIDQAWWSKEISTADRLLNSGLYLVLLCQDQARESEAADAFAPLWRPIENWLGLKGRRLEAQDLEKIKRGWGAYHIVFDSDVSRRATFNFERKPHPRERAIQKTFRIVKKALEQESDIREDEVPPKQVTAVFDNLIFSIANNYIQKVDEQIKVAKDQYRQLTEQVSGAEDEADNSPSAIHWKKRSDVYQGNVIVALFFAAILVFFLIAAMAS